MSLIDVTVNKDGKSAAEQYDFGDDLNSMKAKFGEEVVFTNAQANMKVRLQAVLRTCLTKGISTADATAKYVPGVQTATTAVDPVIGMKAKFATMDKEERKAFLAELKDL